MSQLTRKGILLLLSAVMLVASGIYLTYAWYTKVTSVSGMDFNAAQWEFTANYEVSDFNIYVMSYDTSFGGKAAPGTAGEIPIILGAKSSDTDVDYEIRLSKETMSDEFKQRIYFYYEDEAGTAKNFTDGVKVKEFTEGYVLRGTIDHHSEETVTLYWEWIYEYTDIPGLDTTGMTADEIAQASVYFDAFDTEVGKSPEKYQDQMSATISIVGTQSSPHMN